MARRLTIEQLEQRCLLTAAPWGAFPADTAEFMLGRVLVTPVFLESKEGGPEDIYDWTEQHIAETKQRVVEGVRWWEETLAGISDLHSLEFLFDFTWTDQPFDTQYEPIARKSIDYSLWVPEFLEAQGFGPSGNLAADVRAFNHAQREAHDTDWSFLIFVANAEHDDDGMFAPCDPGDGQCFSRAFAFAGGLFFVSPSTRPASTFAHETGHMFWAMDEYQGGGTYFNQRGYYNTQNENAWNNPDPDFVQQPSIMASGSLLNVAYEQFTSAEATLAQIGWQDTSGNGIFDVLDVPHQLSGHGFFDPELDRYRFIGEATVATLPNLNSSGLGNDITLNRISRIEYRIDDGDWQTAQHHGLFQVAIDLELEVPGDASQIAIRAIDDRLGITSNVFIAALDQPSFTPLPGINGFVWHDTDADGQWDVRESPLSGWTIQLVDTDGQLLLLRENLEPDDYSADANISSVHPSITVTAVGGGVWGSEVRAINSSITSTGDRVFGHHSNITNTWSAAWAGNRRLRIAFDEPVSTVSIDAIGNSSQNWGRLEIYDAQDRLLERYTTGELGPGEIETMTLSWPTHEIAYAIAYGHANTTVHLDNLWVGPETVTSTNSFGGYVIPSLPPGTYQTVVTPPAGWSFTTEGFDRQTVSVGEGESVTYINFGARQLDQSPWQNPENHLDVNTDGMVSPIDALLVINELNRNGARTLTDDPAPPYLDVNGDGFLSPIDALMIINHLNAVNAAGEGESTSSPNVVAGGSGNPQFTSPNAGAEGEPLGPLEQATGGVDAPLRDVPLRAPLFTKTTLAWQFAAESAGADVNPWRMAQNGSAAVQAERALEPDGETSSRIRTDLASSELRHDRGDRVWGAEFTERGKRLLWDDGPGFGGDEDELLDLLAADQQEMNGAGRA